MGCTVLAVEIIEALLWASPGDLVSITEAVQHTCAPRNEFLTRLLFPIVFIQPTLNIFACRRSGMKENYLLLMVPERLSLLSSAAGIVTWIAGEVFDFHLNNIEGTNFIDFRGKQTCTFLG